ncbi:MAG: hypothetical protein IPL53_21255 [Ignavibacteria bacterium]|nr:hypothetical protein [Ignavibacteria bacterium]
MKEKQITKRDFGSSEPSFYRKNTIQNTLNSRDKNTAVKLNADSKSLKKEVWEHASAEILNTC